MPCAAAFELCTLAVHLLWNLRTESVDSIIAGWQDDLKAFMKLREKYLLYRDSGISED